MRNLSLDYFKVILAFFIVCLHSGFFYDISELVGYLFVHGLFRIAVPIFFIINGFFFYKIVSISDLKKWIKRIFVLYIIWTIIYLPVMIYSLDPMQTIVRLFTGYFMLWYLVAMMLAGIMLYFIKKNSDSFLLFFSLLLLIIGYAIQTIGNMHIFGESVDNFLNWGTLYCNFLFFGFPFFTMGYLIRKKNITIGIKKGIFLSILFFGFLLIESYFNYRISKEGVDILLSLFFLCPVIFLLIKQTYIQGSAKNIANFSTGVFLIHAYVLFFLRFTFDLDNTALCLVTLLLSCMASLLLIQVNNRFKCLL